MPAFAIAVLTNAATTQKAAAAIVNADAWGDFVGNRGITFFPIDGYCRRKVAAKAHRARGLRDSHGVAGVAQWNGDDFAGVV